MEQQPDMEQQSEQVLDPVQDKKENVVVPKKVKKEPPLAPRVQAKLKELEQRGLLTSAKAYVPPQDMAAMQMAKVAKQAAQKEQSV